MPTPSIQTLRADAQQVLNLDSISAVRSVVAATLANANAGTPLNPNLTTQQLWNEFYQIVTQPKSDIESIIANQLMKFLFAPPAPGGAGADKQVIFNDGGVLAGDPQFLWNKTTNLLTVTGAATITGNLTVQTNKLFVNAGGAAVGTTSVFADFQVQRSTNARLEIDSASTGISYQVLDNARTGYLQNVTIASQHLWFNGASEAMRLNSTGLGVGVSPSQKLHLYSNTTPAAIRLQSASPYAYPGDFTVGAGGFGTPSFYIYDNTNSAFRFVLDTSGNVGIGVTPSAWNASYKALQIGASCFANYGTELDFGQNFYVNSSGNYIYVSSSSASYYRQYLGTHAWFYAASGTAGNPITFTQAMTLDASGNLLVGKTTSGAFTDGCQLFPAGTISIGHPNGTGSGAAYSIFAYDGVKTGDITQNGTTGVLYNTVSDYRLKESVTPLSGGLARVSALKPSIYKWKSDGSSGEGFLAHELAEVVPFAVTGEKDAVNEDGSIKAQSIDMSRVVPILVAAIQELAAEVNALKNA